MLQAEGPDEGCHLPQPQAGPAEGARQHKGTPPPPLHSWGSLERVARVGGVQAEGGEAAQHDSVAATHEVAVTAAQGCADGRGAAGRRAMAFSHWLVTR